MNTRDDNDNNSNLTGKEKPVGQRHESISKGPEQRQDRQMPSSEANKKRPVSTNSKPETHKEKRLGDETEINDETTI